MDISVVVATILVLVVLAVVAYALFELSPLAHHRDSYRDPLTHKSLFESPHLETRDEFERPWQGT